MPDPIFPTKHVEEGEWERVCRMREEGHPLMKGGRCAENRRLKIASGVVRSGKGQVKRHKPKKKKFDPKDDNDRQFGRGSFYG